MVKYTVLAIFIVLCMCSSVLAIPQDNLIENGTFDTDMNNWNLATSTNFTISSNNSVAEFNTTHTDWHWDENYSHFVNGTLQYNITLQNGTTQTPTGTGYIEMSNITTPLLNNSGFNESLGNWTYTEFGNSSSFIREQYDHLYKIESQKLHNTTELYLNGTVDPGGSFYGYGADQFKWLNHGSIECNFTRTNNSIRYWTVGPKTGAIKYGTSCNITLNNTITPELNSVLWIGFWNTNNFSILTRNYKLFRVEVYNSTHLRINYHVRNRNGAGVGSPYTYIPITNLTNGLQFSIYYLDTSGTKFFITDNSGTILHSFILSGVQSLYADIDCFVITSSFSPVPVRTIYANITNITVWQSPYNIQTSGVAQISQTIVVPNGVKITASTYNKHYHDPQNGLIRSSMEVLHSTLTKTVYNQSTTSSTSGNNNNLEYNLTTGGTTTVKLWTYQTLTEGATTFGAKISYWNDCYINSTVYSQNATFISRVIDSTYFADWQDCYINYEYDYLFGYRFTTYTRTGDTSTPDGTWSGWSAVTFVGEKANLGSYQQRNTINSLNGRYIQYKMDMSETVGYKNVVIFSVGLSSVPIAIAEEWGYMTQFITKPYTNYTTLKYKYKIDYLNNTDKGNITVSFASYEVEVYNFTYYTTSWISREYTLPSTYNASGTYELNFSVKSRFNSTNGTATILFDDIEVLIDSQAPIITEFNVTEVNANLVFGGIFTDYTRDSNYQLLGLGGIDSVVIDVGSFTLDVTNITFLGNGTYIFSHTWDNTPTSISNTTTLESVLRVTDTDGLYDISSILEVTLPKLMNYLLALVASGLLLLIIILILQDHIVSDEKKDYLPEMITGKKKR